MCEKIVKPYLHKHILQNYDAVLYLFNAEKCLGTQKLANIQTKTIQYCSESYLIVEYYFFLGYLECAS